MNVIFYIDYSGKDYGVCVEVYSDGTTAGASDQCQKCKKEIPDSEPLMYFLEHIFNAKLNGEEVSNQLLDKMRKSKVVKQRIEWLATKELNEDPYGLPILCDECSELADKADKIAEQEEKKKIKQLRHL